MKTLKTYLAGILTTLIIISCETSTYDDLVEQTTPPEETEVISYEEDIRPVLEASCTNCHAPGGPASFAPLTNYAEASASIQQILDRIQRPASQPGAMPPGGQSLPQNTINLFINWEETGLLETEE